LALGVSPNTPAVDAAKAGTAAQTATTLAKLIFFICRIISKMSDGITIYFQRDRLRPSPEYTDHFFFQAKTFY
jgi:hypothetical protein